jgi:hypothetical protein
MGWVAQVFTLAVQTWVYLNTFLVCLYCFRARKLDVYISCENIITLVLKIQNKIKFKNIKLEDQTILFCLHHVRSLQTCLACEKLALCVCMFLRIDIIVCVSVANYGWYAGRIALPNILKIIIIIIIAMFFVFSLYVYYLCWLCNWPCAVKSAHK